MTGRVRVVVATTEGPSTVLRVTPEDPSLRSVICLGRSTTVLPVSPAYDAFVRSPTGVVERAVGHAAFRVDMSAPIDGGDSWQLGLYLAHLLKAAGRLAEDDKPAGLVLWVTGAVDGDLAVHPVGRLDDKLRHSQSLFAATGGRLLALIPAGIEGAPPDGVLPDGRLPDGGRVLAVAEVAAALRHLRLEGQAGRVGQRRRRVVLAGLAAAVAAVVAVAVVPQPSGPDPSPTAPVPMTPVPMTPGPMAPVPAAPVAAPVFDPSTVRLAILEARPADGASCAAGEVLEPADPGRESVPGVCAVLARAANDGPVPGFLWLVALVEGTFREYSGGSRSVEIAVGPLAAGETAEVRVAAPPWVRRPVVFRVLLVLAGREDGQVSQALAAVDVLSTDDFDRLTGQFIDLGLEVRTLRHRVQPRP